LLWSRHKLRPELIFAGCLCGGAWMAYAMTSTNYSGVCCSIRWFVPLLAPSFYVLVLLLRDYPNYRVDLLILSAGGLVIAGVAWCYGPWIKHMVPGYWAIQGATLAAWLTWSILKRRRAQNSAAAIPHQGVLPARAA